MGKCRRCRANVEDEPEQWCETCEPEVHPRRHAKAKKAPKAALPKVTDEELAAVVPAWQPQPLLSVPESKTLWQKMKALWQ